MGIIKFSGINTDALSNIVNGYLYNNYAIRNPSNLAASGWHVPSASDYADLNLHSYLGWANTGYGMKETGTTYWDSPNPASNEFKFNGRGAGGRDAGGTYSGLKHKVDFGISDALVPNGNCWFGLIHDTSMLMTYYAGATIGTLRNNGISVRLVKDTTSLSHGETGTYTGNDGKRYRTICISTNSQKLEWLADNLAETKYRDGTTIPNMPLQAAWSSNTDGARVAYDNNETNALIETPQKYNKLQLRPVVSITSYGGLDGSVCGTGYTRTISGTEGILTLNGSTFIQLPGNASLAGYNDDISFKLYLDVSQYDQNWPKILFYNSSSTNYDNNYLSIYLMRNHLIVEGGQAQTAMITDISALSQQTLNIKIKREDGGTFAKIVYVQINDVSRGISPSYSVLGAINQKASIGSGSTHSAFVKGDKSSIWDFNIPNMHYWKGYPIGNTNAAWEDKIVTNISGTDGHKLILTKTNNAVYGIDWKLTVIRNAEMNNIIGDATSTDLIISAINGSTLTVPNLPNYDGFLRETSTWACKSTDTNTTATLCTNIDLVNKTVTVNNISQFGIGNSIALYNPFLNWEFVGDQTSGSFIPPSGSYPWMNSETGAGVIFKIGPNYNVLFQGLGVGISSVGLACASSLSGPWTVSNGGNAFLTAAQAAAAVDAEITSVYPTGRIHTLDSSMYITVCSNKGPFLMYFGEDLSTRTYSSLLIPKSYFPNGTGYGSIEKIGDNYHILVLDVSTALAKREIQAWKSSSLQGTYTLYQRIYRGELSPYGTAWDYITDGPNLFYDGYKYMALFGGQAQGGSYGAGVGNTNRVQCLLDFDPITETWSLNSKGPVLINPIDWPGAYSWCADHTGAVVCTYFEDNDMYLGACFKGYRFALLRLKNYTKS